MSSTEHEWFEWRGMTCCKKCGIVKRRDGKNKPCKGVVRVTLRRAAQDLLDAINHNLDTGRSPQKYGVPFGEARVLAMAIDLDSEPTP